MEEVIDFEGGLTVRATTDGNRIRLALLTTTPILAVSVTLEAQEMLLLGEMMVRGAREMLGKPKRDRRKPVAEDREPKLGTGTGG